MIRLNVDLTDEMKRKAELRAAESGHASLENYVQSLLRADTDGVEEPDPGAPSHLHVASDDELESLLLSRLDNGEPSIEPSPEFWEAMKARARSGARTDSK